MHKSRQLFQRGASKAQDALDLATTPAAWRGIRDEANGQCWWRIDDEAAEIPTTNTSDARDTHR